MIPEVSFDETIKQLNHYVVINCNLRLNRFLVEICDVIFLTIPSVQSRLSQNGHTGHILAVTAVSTVTVTCHSHRQQLSSCT
jgi:hypothetical protein